MAKMTFSQMVVARIRRRFSGPVETSDHADKNPLGLVVGKSNVCIDWAEYRDLLFSVVQIRHVLEEVWGKGYPMTDYELRATPHSEGDKIRLTLRVYPAGEPDAEYKHDLVLLKEFYSATHDQAVADGLWHPDYHLPQCSNWVAAPALQDPDGVFIDHEESRTYQRRFGDREPHVTHATLIHDADGDGRVQSDEVEDLGELTYWDFEEKSESPDSVVRPRPKFLFAEMDRDGQFRLLRGSQLYPEQVSLI